MQKMVAKALPDMLVLYTECKKCKGTGKKPTGRPDGTYYACDECGGFPRTLTPFGSNLKLFMQDVIEERIADLSVR
jgi:hypothetical protein